jgi:hypothetical protein
MAKERQKTQRSVSRFSSRTPHVQPVSGAGPEHPNGHGGISSLALDPLSPAARTDSGMEDRKQDALHVDEAGPRWLRIRWTVTEKTLARAASALGRDGHRCTRVLRLSRVEHDDAGPRSKELAGEIEIPLDASEWFLRVPAAGDAWGVEIGMLNAKGRFFSLLHSAPLQLRAIRSPASSSEKLLTAPPTSDSPEPPSLKAGGMFLLSGATRPHAQMTIDDQPVEVDARTGAFEWRVPVANGREVFPIMISDAGKTHRALLAVEVNLRVLDPEPRQED